jgi:NADP-dependent 3-hydroxy acid dehydrogenase YdfG
MARETVKDRVVIVTGASSGIGAATVRLLAQAGMRVVLAARRVERLEQVQREIVEAGGSALVVPTDVTQRDALQNLIARTLDEWDRIDVLVNNAGLGRLNWLERIDPVDVRRQYEVNVLGTIYAAQLALPVMIRQRWGHIINMASLAAKIATPTYSIYASTKFAIDGFSRALRREVSVWNIQISTLYPSYVRTEEFGRPVQYRRKTGLRMPSPLVLSEVDVAQTILRLIRHPKSGVIMPAIMRLPVWIDQVAPWILDLASKRWVQRERSAELKR